MSIHSLSLLPLSLLSPQLININHVSAVPNYTLPSSIPHRRLFQLGRITELRDESTFPFEKSRSTHDQGKRGPLVAQSPVTAAGE